MTQIATDAELAKRLQASPVLPPATATRLIPEVGALHTENTCLLPQEETDLELEFEAANRRLEEELASKVGQDAAERPRCWSSAHSAEVDMAAATGAAVLAVSTGLPTSHSVDAS
jgi:hypothetical protein